MSFFRKYNLTNLFGSLVILFSIISTLWFLLLMLVTSFWSFSLVNLSLSRLILVFSPLVFAMASMLVYLIVTGMEITSRLFNDRVMNYVKSHKHSKYFRRFLQLDEKTTEEIKMGSVRRFNFYVNLLTVNITDDRVEIIIPIPPRLESFNILKSTLPLVREEISNRITGYNFQQPERENFYFKIIGRKN